MPNQDLTQHAILRAQQRGVPHHLIDTLLENADIDAPVGGSCRLLRVSRRRLLDQSLRGEADRLSRLAVVWSDHTSSIVTIVHHFRGRAGRRYRAVQ